MGGSSLEGSVGIGDGTSSVVVEMGLDVAADDSSEGSDELVDLTGVGASDSVGDSDSVDSDLVDGTVEVKEVDEV